jgi:hypothetical protein
MRYVITRSDCGFKQLHRRTSRCFRAAILSSAWTSTPAAAPATTRAPDIVASRSRGHEDMARKGMSSSRSFRPSPSIPLLPSTFAMDWIRRSPPLVSSPSDLPICNTLLSSLRSCMPPRSELKFHFLSSSSNFLPWLT